MTEKILNIKQHYIVESLSKEYKVLRIKYLKSNSITRNKTLSIVKCDKEICKKVTRIMPVY